MKSVFMLKRIRMDKVDCIDQMMEKKSGKAGETKRRQTVKQTETERSKIQQTNRSTRQTGRKTDS